MDKEVAYSVIDGQQRLQSIWSFIDCKFSLNENFVYFKNPQVAAGGMNYFNLEKHYPDLKSAFDAYVLPIMCIETDDIYLIDEMFLRLYEAGSLENAARIYNLDSPVIKIIRQVASHPFFKNYVLFSDNKNQHKAVAAKLLFLEHCISKFNKIINLSESYINGFIDS